MKKKRENSIPMFLSDLRKTNELKLAFSLPKIEPLIIYQLIRAKGIAFKDIKPSF